MPATLIEFPQIAPSGQQRSSGTCRKRKSKVHVLPQLSQKWMKGIADLHTAITKMGALQESKSICLPMDVALFLANGCMEHEIERVRVEIEAGQIEPGRFKFKSVKGKYVVEDCKYAEK